MVSEWFDAADRIILSAGAERPHPSSSLLLSRLELSDTQVYDP